MQYRLAMDRICSHCHAVLAAQTSPGAVPDWCPACGGALVDRPAAPAASQASEHSAWPPAQVDHRGILLPRRHALGGVITPQ
jgi:hypothetical protein